MARRTRAKDLRRPDPTRDARKTIVIFCEGEASEPDYLNGLKRLPEIRERTSVRIELATPHGVPLTLVQHALEKANDDEVDECWCVFDVEWPKNHPHLREAIDLAARHEKVQVAVSNPCFELWLILHYQDCDRPISTRDADRESRRLDDRKGKRIDAGRYLPTRREAARRAESLARRHADNGTDFPGDNPSSSMYELLAAIEG